MEDVEIVPREELREHETGLRNAVGDVLPISLSTSLLRDKRQNPIGLVLVVRDLREVVKLRDRLVVSDRLAAVGQLAAGIAHEINNPAAFVRANLSTLGSLLESIRAELPASSQIALSADLAEGFEIVDESIEGVERIASIVSDVKDFSHAGSGGHVPIDLSRLLDGVVRMAKPQRPPRCRIELDHRAVPRILGSAPELQQVFLNLVINAFQAIDGEGSIRISTALDGDWVDVSIRDEGAGIPPETINRIFDPFFTTKPVGEGTGLGLSISYQIVKNHGGEIVVDSTPGRGTVFHVRLPVIADAG